MSRLVLEASVVAKLLIPEDYSNQALALLADVGRLHWEIHAPWLLPAEVLAIIRRQMRRKRLSLADGLVMLDDFAAIPTTLVGTIPLLRRALEHSERYGLSTYDAQYVALADMLNCDVWAADEGLLRAAGGRLPFIRSSSGSAPTPG